MARFITDSATSDGCRLAGYVEVKRAPGNFHISVHNTGYSLDSGFLNLTHLVRVNSILIDPPNQFWHSINK